MRQVVLRDSAAVIAHGKDGPAVPLFNAQPDFDVLSRVLRGVFQEIEQHLADENRVHGHDKQLIRN